MRNINIFNTLVAPLLLTLASTTLAQPGGSGGGGGAARTQAPIELTGNWVSLVTEDWRFRMLTAPAGDFEGISLTPAGREIATNWDADADQGCLAYGVGGLMRQPTRLQISWEGDNILRIDTDAGEQTRLLKFGSAQDDIGAGSLQGISNASWTVARGGRGAPPAGGNLNVTTTDMSMGYFRTNGVPYSEQTTITENYELLQPGNGEEYLVIISVLEDPLYVSGVVMTSTNFKREANDDGWSPKSCD